ncbi:twin-arginine translocation signal domain-containing protein [Silvibacterium dinghuense]|uniref:Twin-arginine translocation signal domain-containing protein n=1 Tax=Silvibacterium dinghuense TaxID=1560006 RepID=A0A4Q1S8P6_9BACT|nr:twin-arginine translocation signal domain-containing protein [Silvibacterium dinghuense]RXS93367.1 twin-arginine translocation signal domain-containing protein [Silvibacterium dinghuense]GGH05261.1 hypothetical protein GCM10011586_21720 [Silvibacterium dinghuense]
MANIATTRRSFLAGLAASAAVLAAPQAQGQEIDAGAVAWEELRGDSDALLKLTLDFHARLEDADPAETLPLALVREAQKIEKAARAIQEQLKGED